MLAGVCAVVTAAFGAPAVIDRIVVIVGKHAIKLSDIDSDLRLTEFINNQPLNLSTADGKKAADHLIDQAVIRDEIALEGYGRATDAQANELLEQILRNRFGGSQTRLRAALERYGLTEARLRDYLRWEMTVLDFIDQRFRAGVLVTDDEVKSYYDSHLAELERRHPKDHTYKTLAPQIRNVLEEQQVNQQFDAWLEETRKSDRIQYVDEAYK